MIQLDSFEFHFSKLVCKKKTREKYVSKNRIFLLVD